MKMDAQSNCDVTKSIKLVSFIKVLHYDYISRSTVMTYSKHTSCRNLQVTMEIDNE